MDITIDYTPTPSQASAHASTAKVICISGGTGSGKGVLLAMDALSLCLSSPGARCGIFRLYKSSYLKTTHRSVQEWILQNPQVKPLIKSHTDGLIVFKNGSSILYGGLCGGSVQADSTDPLTALRSAEFTALYIDEATDLRSEPSVLDFALTRVGRVRSLNPATGRREFARGKVMITANPVSGTHWIKRRFIDQVLPDHHHITARSQDNTHLPPDYVEGLRRLWRNNPEQLAALVDGSWGEFKGKGNSVFPPEILTGRLTSMPLHPDNEVCLGVDVGAWGCDPTIVILRQNYTSRIVYEAVGQSLMRTANEIAQLADREGASRIVADVVGVGCGVYDRLEELGYPVVAFNGGAKADDPDRFLNLRASSFWHLRDLLERGSIIIPTEGQVTEELRAITFMRAKDRLIAIEKKADLKKRLGRSTNYADALAMAWWEASPGGDAPGLGYNVNIN